MGVNIHREGCTRRCSAGFDRGKKKDLDIITGLPASMEGKKKKLAHHYGADDVRVDRCSEFGTLTALGIEPRTSCN